MLTKKSNLLHDIDEWLKRFKNSSNEKKLILSVHPSLGEKLKEGRIKTITKLQFKYFVKIKLDETELINPATFKFILAKTQKDITHDYIA